MSEQPETARILGFNYTDPIPDAAGWKRVLSDPEKAPSALKADAYYGSIGEFTALVAPYVPYGPEGILVQLLVSVGSLLGEVPFLEEGPKRIHPNLFGLVVGTSGGGKGASLGWNEWAMQRLDGDFWRDRRVTSMGSGEGLLKVICDPVYGLDSKGEEVLKDKGSADKRVLYVEEEAGSIFLRTAQQPVMEKFITTAFDSGTLMSVVKETTMKCETPHVSIIGHITPDELVDKVTRSHVTNGFLNRWLVCVIKSNAIDDSLTPPDQISGLGDVITRLRDNLKRFTDGPQRFRITGDADKIRRETVTWVRENIEPGAMEHMSVRFQTLTLKAAMVYAAADGTNVIDADHIRAARAVVAYSQRSIRAFYGGVFFDDRDEFMTLWRDTGYADVSLTDITNMFSRNMNATKRDGMLKRLIRDGLIEINNVPSGKGRPSRVVTRTATDTTTNDW